MMQDLSGFQRDMLYVISGLENPKGLAVKRELQKHYSDEINHGRLYPNLDDLVEKGLLVKGTKDRRTNEYRLSERGMREIKSRREWEDGMLDGKETAVAKP